ncbi:MAG TPA: hypothetical protein VF816_00285 [Rhodocyclaceae bacterium]
MSDKDAAEKVIHQESKEYQLKIDVAAHLPPHDRVPGRGDEALFKAVAKALHQAVASLAHDHRIDIHDNGWRRDALRYDTAEGRFKANDLTLAIEATDERTKLKCKRHSFIPELLFQRPDHATVYPDIRASGVYKKHDTKLKREQDIHLDNIKTCASGSLFVKGRQTDVKDTSFFLHYYPRLDSIVPGPVPLKTVSHWDECVYDDMRVRYGRVDIDTWMLVNRWDAKTQALLESELSFKVVKNLDDPWDCSQLKDAGELYHALDGTGLFMELPPIFTFFDPVSSIDILRAP